MKQLGKGGCGEVYLAQYVSGKKQSYKYCAIKFIKNKKVFYAETSTMKYLMENTTCGKNYCIYYRYIIYLLFLFLFLFFFFIFKIIINEYKNYFILFFFSFIYFNNNYNND